MVSTVKRWYLLRPVCADQKYVNKKKLRRLERQIPMVLSLVLFPQPFSFSSRNRLHTTIFTHILFYRPLGCNTFTPFLISCSHDRVSLAEARVSFASSTRYPVAGKHNTSTPRGKSRTLRVPNPWSLVNYSVSIKFHSSRLRNTNTKKRLKRWCNTGVLGAASQRDCQRDCQRNSQRT